MKKLNNAAVRYVLVIFVLCMLFRRFLGRFHVKYNMKYEKAKKFTSHEPCDLTKQRLERGLDFTNISFNLY